MAPRKSQYFLARKGRSSLEFWPPLDEWKEVCGIAAFDTHIYRYFKISHETFLAFMDRERYKEENGERSEHLEIYKEEKKKMRGLITNAFRNNLANNDTSSVIFGLKAYHGLMEYRDVANIEMKRQELELKRKHFLTDLAKEFNLTYEQLDKFSQKYFSENKFDNV